MTHNCAGVARRMLTIARPARRAFRPAQACARAGTSSRRTSAALPPFDADCWPPTRVQTFVVPVRFDREPTQPVALAYPEVAVSDADRILRHIGVLAEEVQKATGANKLIYEAAHLFLCYAP